MSHNRKRRLLSWIPALRGSPAVAESSSEVRNIDTGAHGAEAGLSSEVNNVATEAQGNEIEPAVAEAISEVPNPASFENNALRTPAIITAPTAPPITASPVNAS